MLCIVSLLLAVALAVIPPGQAGAAPAPLQVEASAAPAVAAPTTSDWVWPVRGETLTPYRNGSDPYAGGQHRGIDIAADAGAAVVAAIGGRVRFAGALGSSGLTVSVRTADGRFDTSYLHLSTIDVRAGEDVATGERIGAAGTTGSRSTEATHLHFGVRDAGVRHGYRDPLTLLPPATPVREGPRGVPIAVPAPVRIGPAPEPVRVPVPSHGQVPRVDVPIGSAPNPFPAMRAPVSRADAGGLDVAWVLACAGLLLAAAVAGGSPRSRRSFSRAGGSTVARLRPLLSGR